MEYKHLFIMYSLNATLMQAMEDWRRRNYIGLGLCSYVFQLRPESKNECVKEATGARKGPLRISTVRVIRD